VPEFKCSDVFHTREIDILTRPDAKIGDVCDENFAWLFLVEPTVQVIRQSPIFIRRLGEFTVGALPTDFRHDPELPHKAKDTFMVHRYTIKIKYLHVKTAIANLPVVPIVNTF
jgi:hypothetical protein